MRKNTVAAVSALLATAGCTRAVRLSPREADRLAGVPEISAVYEPSPQPFVDCATDEGEKTWSFPGSRNDVLPGPGQPRLASSGAGEGSWVPAAFGGVGTFSAGSTWQAVQNERTEKLRTSPPIDPAGATGAAFLAGARKTQVPLRFGDAIVRVEKADAAALARRFGPVPLLVFETTRFALVACWYDYQPWFNVRASLVDAGTGAVLWRDACGGLYPRPSAPSATNVALEQDGMALYARMLEERAQDCAAELVAKLGREAPGQAGSR